jgi:hypothetical protein
VVIEFYPRFSFLFKFIYTGSISVVPPPFIDAWNLSILSLSLPSFAAF